MPCHGANACSLYQKIDTEKLQCLNEAVEGSGRTIFKPWEERFDRNEVLYLYNTNTSMALILLRSTMPVYSMCVSWYMWYVVC